MFALLSSPFSSIFPHHTEQKTLGEEEAEALISVPKEKDELYVCVNYLRYPGRPKEHWHKQLLLFKCSLMLNPQLRLHQLTRFDYPPSTLSKDMFYY